MPENYKPTEVLWDNFCMILSSEYFKFISFGGGGVIAGSKSQTFAVVSCLQQRGVSLPRAFFCLKKLPFNIHAHGISLLQQSICF